MGGRGVHRWVGMRCVQGGLPWEGPWGAQAPRRHREWRAGQWAGAGPHRGLRTRSRGKLGPHARVPSTPWFRAGSAWAARARPQSRTPRLTSTRVSVCYHLILIVFVWPYDRDGAQGSQSAPGPFPGHAVHSRANL